MHWYIDVLKRYADFNGRAGRKEYWMFILLNIVIGSVVFTLDRIILGENTLPYLYSLYGAGMMLPALGVAVRRLHDSDLSGLWCFVCLVPLAGGLVLLYFLVRKGTPVENRYGSVPATQDMINRI